MTDELDATNRKFQRELNSGAIALVLLAVLGRAERALYGYQIAKILEGESGGGLTMKQGSLYPALRSLERSGLLMSEVEPSSSGPPRRYYRITPTGLAVLEDWTAIWQRSTGFVDRALKGEHHAADH
jgi:PadR family transcriptional regulator, regulatory protein PadR